MKIQAQPKKITVRKISALYIPEKSFGYAVKSNHSRAAGGRIAIIPSNPIGINASK